MYATKYDSEADRWNILQVLKKREMSLALADDLPRIGIVVYEEDHFIAAGFLRLCEGNHGLLDSYITNPTMPPSVRDQAMDMIMKRLLERAKKLEIKEVFGFCMDDNTISRAIRHGFAITQHKMLVKAN